MSCEGEGGNLEYSWKKDGLHFDLNAHHITPGPGRGNFKFNKFGKVDEGKEIDFYDFTVLAIQCDHNKYKHN